MRTEAVRFLVLWMARWRQSCQLEVIDCLREENRGLRARVRVDPGADGVASPLTCRRVISS